MKQISCLFYAFTTYSQESLMSIYIIRPKTTSLARSLKLGFRKFTPESREAQVAEVVSFWQEDPVHQQIEDWLEDAQKETSEVSKYPDYSGITGASVVEMPDEEAQRIREELPNALILRDQPIELIQPQRNANTKDQLTKNELWHLDAIALNIARQNGFTGTGKNITIAVLDTGIDSTHPELQGNLSNFVMWLDWLALRVDVNIANISAGLPTYAYEMNDVIDTLLAVGILPVCAVGNNGRNNTRTPANCRSSVSVGATNFNSKVAGFSGSGRISVNNHSYNVPYLVAPGEGVYSSVQGGGYEAWDGTSMATPIVSGVAALILEKYSKQIPVLDLIDGLLTSCQDLGHDKERQGKGLIQVTAAL